MKPNSRKQPEIYHYDDGLVFHEGVVCYIDNIQYSFPNRLGQLQTGGAISNTNMSGAIAIFSAIDPDVQEVQVFRSDNTLDIVYKRAEQWNWKWRSRRWPRPVNPEEEFV